MDRKTIRIIGISLLLTAGASAIYFLTETGYNIYLGAVLIIASAMGIVWAYRYTVKLIDRKKGKKKREMPAFSELHTLENPWVAGEVAFFLEVQIREKIQVNILDKEDNPVAVLMDGEKDPGGYRIGFDSRNFSDGIYYYQLVTPNQRTVKKMAIRNKDQV